MCNDLKLDLTYGYSTRVTVGCIGFAGYDAGPPAFDHFSLVLDIVRHGR